MNTHDPLVALAQRQNPLSVAEAGAFLGVSPKTIRQMIRERDLAATKTAGKYAIDPESLLAYVRKNSEPKMILLK